MLHAYTSSHCFLEMLGVPPPLSERRGGRRHELHSGVW